ncbi:FUSC family protein [Virgibacillus sp. L01]|uniref:FUSC family protein n=1 Tax=Virgibacillus sp. L01 TaxID=3457429 RepID=UPI003FD05BE6
MKGLHLKHHWIGRLLASDPGQIRFQKAGKATISLICAVMTTLLILRMMGNGLITPAVVSGMAGLMGIMMVMDETKNERKVTTLLLLVSGAAGITIGSVFAGNAYYISLLLIAVIFSSLYFSRFGVRYFSLCMLGFMTIYISSVLKLSQGQLPLFYMGILIGVLYAFLFNFILFQDSSLILRRSMRSFHIQSNLTFNMLVKALQDKDTDLKHKQNIETNVHKLRLYARTVAANLNAEDINKIWPGLEPSQLRLYVFDTGMLVETLTGSIYNLKKADALELDELRRILKWVMESLRDAEVLSQNYNEKNMQEAALAVQALRNVIRDLLNHTEKQKGWVYLIRRIESIANHVVEAGITMQGSLNKGELVQQEEQADEEADDDSSDDNKELKTSTKKAYQALIAGGIAVIVGHLISPTQPYWVVLTAFVCLLGTESIGRIYTKGFQRSFGTVIGAVIGFMLAKMLAGHSTLELILLFLVIFLAFYLITVSYTLMSVFITMLIAFMYDILLGGISFSLIGSRVVDTIAGAIIALGVSTVIFPKKTKDKVADVTDDYLAELKPFVTSYVRRFREDVSVKELTDSAIDIDNKLQLIEDEARPLLIKRTQTSSTSDVSRWVTIFTAINYFARHLVASSYRKKFDYPAELVDTFKQVEEKLEHNMDILGELIKGTERTGTVYRLEKEREQIEQLAPSMSQSHQDLIHHLFYVWRINQSIVALAIDLGADEK